MSTFINVWAILLLIFYAYLFFIYAFEDFFKEMRYKLTRKFNNRCPAEILSHGKRLVDFEVTKLPLNSLLKIKKMDWNESKPLYKHHKINDLTFYKVKLYTMFYIYTTNYIVSSLNDTYSVGALNDKMEPTRILIKSKKFSFNLKRMYLSYKQL